MNHINTHAMRVWRSTSAGDLAECRCAWSFPAIKLEVSSLLFHWRGGQLARLPRSIAAEPLQMRWGEWELQLQLHNSVIVLPSCCVFFVAERCMYLARRAITEGRGEKKTSHQFINFPDWLTFWHVSISCRAFSSPESKGHHGGAGRGGAAHQLHKVHARAPAGRRRRRGGRRRGAGAADGCAKPIHIKLFLTELESASSWILVRIQCRGRRWRQGGRCRGAAAAGKCIETRMCQARMCREIVVVSLDLHALLGLPAAMRAGRQCECACPAGRGAAGQAQRPPWTGMSRLTVHLTVLVPRPCRQAAPEHQPRRPRGRSGHQRAGRAAGARPGHQGAA